MKFYLSTLLDMQYFAHSFASLIEKGDALALEGDLGVGKSSFARSFIRAFLGQPHLEVPSPSFALVQPYEGKKAMIYHYDLWRIDEPEHIYELGWDDACEEIMLIEWAQKAGSFLPEHRITLMFSFIEGEEEGRLVEIIGLSDEKYRQLKMHFSELTGTSRQKDAS